MTTYSKLTSGQDALVAAAVANLTAAGYSWNRSTTSINAYLATALTGLGGTATNLGFAGLLAALVNQLGAGPVTALNTGIDDLLALVASTPAAGIQLSNASFTAGSAQGTAIGTLSVTGGTGTYTFTLTDSASSKVQVAGTNGVNLQAGSAAASAGSFSITVHADNGAGSTFDRTFSITATAAAASADSDPYPVLF